MGSTSWKPSYINIINEIADNDINCVDWNYDIGNQHLIITGSSDGSISIIDIRTNNRLHYFSQNYYQSSGDNQNIYHANQLEEDVSFE